MENCYALPTDKLYPIDTKEQVELAYKYFDRAHRNFDPTVRAVYAFNTEKRAMQLGCKCKSDYITKYAKAVRCEEFDYPTFKRAMSLRRDACSGKKESIEMINRIEKLASEPGENKELKLMEAIDLFDKHAGLPLFYDSQIPDPISSLYDSGETLMINFGKSASLSAASLCAKKDDEETLKKIASIYGRKMRESFQRNPIIAVNELNELGKIAFFEKVLK